MGVSDSVNDAEEQSNLNVALQELDTMFPSDGFQALKLRLSVRRDGVEEALCDVSWSGVTICLGGQGSAKPADAEESYNVPVEGCEINEHVQISYTFGRYHAHLKDPRSSDTVLTRIWLRLSEEQSHWLRPDDVFRIGDLEFRVNRFNVGSCSDQGVRKAMEDDEIVMQDAGISNWRNCSFFAVYDGHGGRDCVEFIRNNLHMSFIASLNEKVNVDKFEKRRPHVKIRFPSSESVDVEWRHCRAEESRAGRDITVQCDNSFRYEASL